MDQQKIGLFLKALRREKGLTQEQLAEVFHVSGRTVSRWENGCNMPDLAILIEISEYYQVDLRELLDGERKDENMNKETEETVLKAVDYTNAKTESHNRRLRWLLIVGAIALVIAEVIDHTALCENATLRAVAEFASGFACAGIIFSIVASGRFGLQLKASKQRLLKRS